MTVRLTGAICFLLAACMAYTASPQSEILDRLVAVVDGEIITLSDVRRERDIHRALGEPVPGDDAAIVQTLIDRILIEQQIAQFPGIQVNEEDVRSRLAAVQDARGIPQEVLIASIRYRIEAAQYFDLRFRQFISVSDEETRDYYDNVFLPAARERGLDPVPPLAQVADLIESNVMTEKLALEIQTWAAAARGRSVIEIFE